MWANLMLVLENAEILYSVSIHTESEFIASLSIWEVSRLNLWESEGVVVNAELKF